MNFTKTMHALVLGSVGIMGATSAHAWELTAGDRLTIDGGGIYNGSFFGVDTNYDSIIQGTEKTVLSQGSTGIIIGASNTTPGAITAPWTFMGEPGYDWMSTPISAGSSFSNTGSVDMSGWMVTWNGQQVDLSTGAWQVLSSSGSGMPTSGYTNGTGIFNWSGLYGDSYTLDYTATVLSGPFLGIQWALHLEGEVLPVPEPSTYGMMLAGLGLVGGAAARRRKQTEI